MWTLDPKRNNLPSDPSFLQSILTTERDSRNGDDNMKRLHPFTRYTSLPCERDIGYNRKGSSNKKSHPEKSSGINEGLLKTSRFFCVLE